MQEVGLRFGRRKDVKMWEFLLASVFSVMQAVNSSAESEQEQRWVGGGDGWR